MLSCWEKFLVIYFSPCMSNVKATKMARMDLSLIYSNELVSTGHTHTHQFLLQLMYMVTHCTSIQFNLLTMLYITCGFCLVDSFILSQSLNHLCLPVVSPAFRLPIQDFPVHSFNPLRKQESVNMTTYHPSHHGLAPEFCLGQSQHLQPFSSFQSQISQKSCSSHSFQHLWFHHCL